MAYPAKTYTFTDENLHPFYGTELNTNFDNIVSGLVDSTKDLNVNKISVVSSAVVSNFNADRVDGVHIAVLTDTYIPRYEATGTKLENSNITDDGTNVKIANSIVQGTYKNSLIIAKDNIVDNVDTSIFTITTTNETGSNDGGGYFCQMSALIGHSASSGIGNCAVKKWRGSFSRAMEGTGNGTNTAIENIFSGASAATTAATRDIGTITCTVTETSEYVQTISFQIDLTGNPALIGVAQVICEVELIWYGFITPPVIAVA